MTPKREWKIAKQQILKTGKRTEKDEENKDDGANNWSCCVCNGP